MQQKIIRPHPKLHKLSHAYWGDTIGRPSSGFEIEELFKVIDSSTVEKYLIVEHPYHLDEYDGIPFDQYRFFQNYPNSILEYHDKIKSGQIRLIFLLQDWWCTLNHAEMKNYPNNEGVLKSLNLYKTIYHSLKDYNLLKNSRFVCAPSTEDVFQYVDWPIIQYNEPFMRYINIMTKVSFKEFSGFNKHFLWLNRRLRPHRLLALHQANKFNLLDNCILTALKWGYESQCDKQYHSQLLNYLPLHEIDLEFTNFKNAVVLGNDYNIETNEQDVPELSSIRSAANKCFVEIVSEFNCSNNKVFLTEKTARAIVNKKPFIIVGDKNSLAELRNNGYKTFDKFWDESYDQKENLLDRVNAIVEQMRNIVSNVNLKDNYSDEMKEILDHNYNTYYSEKTKLNKTYMEIFN